MKRQIENLRRLKREVDRFNGFESENYSKDVLDFDWDEIILAANHLSEMLDGVIDFAQVEYDRVDQELAEEEEEEEEEEDEEDEEEDD